MSWRALGPSLRSHRALAVSRVFVPRLWTAPLALMCALAFIPAIPGAAEPVPDDDRNLVNWNYALAFGTGAYRIADRTVAVIRVPLSYNLTRMGDDRWGLKLTLPVAFGFVDFGFLDVVDGLPDRFGTFSMAPGFELAIPMRHNWRLKPFLNAGFGKEYENNVTALLYSGGLKSLHTRGWDKLNLELGNSLTFAGYNPDSGESESLSAFITGLSFRYPLGLCAFGRRMNVGAEFTWYAYFNDLTFSQPFDDTKSVSQEFELGATLGVYEPFRILGGSFDRIGLAFRLGDGLTGVRLVTYFPF